MMMMMMMMILMMMVMMMMMMMMMMVMSVIERMRFEDSGDQAFVQMYILVRACLTVTIIKTRTLQHWNNVRVEYCIA